MQPYFVIFGVSQIDTHLCFPIQSYSNQSKVGRELYHKKSLTGNQPSDPTDSPEACGYFLDNVVYVGVPGYVLIQINTKILVGFSSF